MIGEIRKSYRKMNSMGEWGRVGIGIAVGAAAGSALTYVWLLRKKKRRRKEMVTPVIDAAASPCVEKGKVYLVGAGPGCVGLLTLRALHVAQTADVVVHDRLVQASLLDSIASRAAAEGRVVHFVNVGKGPTKDRYPQSKINEALISWASKGFSVARLKGGDPFVFGLGGDECIALRSAGIPFEVIPGISSALAVPLFAGIPVTQKNVAMSFTVVSGHKAPGDDGSADWDNLPKRNNTLIVLMGMKKLAMIANRLIANGTYGADTMAAVVESGTLQKQRVFCASLDSIAAEAETHGVKPPGILVVGDVVGFRKHLEWFRNQESDANAESWGRAQRSHIVPLVAK